MWQRVGTASQSHVSVLNGLEKNITRPLLYIVKEEHHCPIQLTIFKELFANFNTKRG